MQDTVACSTLMDDEFSIFEYMGKDNYYYNTIKEFGICPRPSDSFVVEGKGSEAIYRLFTIKIMPCSLPAGCESVDEMAKANFQIVLPSSNYQLSSKDDPHKFILNVDDVYYINPTVKQMFNSKTNRRPCETAVVSFQTGATGRSSTISVRLSAPRASDLRRSSFAKLLT